MKKLLKNKKVLLAMAVAGIVAASGLTYAWFTQQVSVASVPINMGALHVIGEVTSDPDYADWYFEPGEGVAAGYNLTNPEKWYGTPTIDTMTRLNTSATVELFTEEPDGETLTRWYNGPINPAVTPFRIGDPSGEIFGMTTDGTQLAWMLFEYTDAQDVTTYYVYTLGGRSAHEAVAIPEIPVGIEFGPAMDNAYQHAKFHIGGNWDATQAYEGTDANGDTISAMKDLWGIHPSELVPASFNSNVSAFSVGGVSVSDAYQLFLQQIQR